MELGCLCKMQPDGWFKSWFSAYFSSTANSHILNDRILVLFLMMGYTL